MAKESGASFGVRTEKKIVLGTDRRSHSWVDSKLHEKGGREEGTLRDTLLFEFARAQILWMALRLQAKQNE